MIKNEELNVVGMKQLFRGGLVSVCSQSKHRISELVNGVDEAINALTIDLSL